MSATDGELPEFLNAGTCSWNLFSTLGISPVLGRSFTPADDNPGAARSECGQMFLGSLMVVHVVLHRRSDDQRRFFGE